MSDPLCYGYPEYCSQQMGRCTGYIEDYASAIKYMEQVRARIPEEAVEATGRIRDRFEFLLPRLDIALRGDEAREAEIREIVKETLARVDTVRDEMLRQGTKYIPHSLPEMLNQAVDRIEARLMEFAVSDLEECVCQAAQ